MGVHMCVYWCVKCLLWIVVVFLVLVERGQFDRLCVDSFNSPSCLSVDEEIRFLAPLSASSRSELRRESEAPATFDMDVDLYNQI